MRVFGFIIRSQIVMVQLWFLSSSLSACGSATCGVPLVLVLSDSVLPCFRLFLRCEFYYMVYSHVAVNRFAHLYLVLNIVVDGLSAYLSSVEAVETAFRNSSEYRSRSHLCSWQGCGSSWQRAHLPLPAVPNDICIVLLNGLSFSYRCRFRLFVSASLSNRSAQPRLKGSL